MAHVNLNVGGTSFNALLSLMGVMLMATPSHDIMPMSICIVIWMHAFEESKRDAYPIKYQLMYNQ